MVLVLHIQVLARQALAQRLKRDAETMLAEDGVDINDGDTVILHCRSLSLGVIP
jgi:hypothetical protein